MPKLIDIHCHLNFKAYENEVEKIIEETLNNDIWTIIPGSQKDTSTRAVFLADKFKNQGIFSAIGLHPEHLFSFTVEEGGETFKSRGEKFDLDFYRQLAKSSQKVVAIGEIGLDYYWLPKIAFETNISEEIIKKTQKKVFVEQLKLANELNLPVIIHCRPAVDNQVEAYNDILSEIKNIPVKGVIHCFTGDYEMAKKFLDIGFYLSFTGVITFKKNRQYYQNLISQLPLEKIMVETDGPYISPEPFRGKINKPIYVRYMAEAIAQYTNRDFQKICEITTQNAQKLFSLNI